MVSPLSARLGYGTGVDSANTSHSSSKGSASGQKRKQANGSLDRRENSVSGYSADREESSLNPPVVSIDLYRQQWRESAKDRSCIKRQKRNELQFAAASVKTDLARAGFEFEFINPNNENTTKLADVSINLKGVKLIRSKDFKARGKRESQKMTDEPSPYDYQALALACWDYYPHITANRSSQHTTTKAFETSTTDNSDRSTSSVSDTDSESGESKNNGNKTIIIPPLLEDALVTGKQRTEAFDCHSNPAGSCNIISSINNAITMGEMLVLSKTPRVVTSASSPFVIMYANAAFLKLSKLAPGAVVGKPFSGILDAGDRGNSSIEGSSHPGLPERLLSSSSGVHKMIRLATVTPNPSETPCYYAKVCPIVARKPTRCEVTKVTHFGVEFVSGPSSPSEDVSSSSSLAWNATEAVTSKSAFSSSPLGDMAVGVMG